MDEQGEEIQMEDASQRSTNANMYILSDKKELQNNLGVNMICIPRTQSALNRLVVT